MPAKAIAWPAVLLTLLGLSCGGTAGTAAPASPAPKGETVELPAQHCLALNDDGWTPRALSADMGDED